MGNFFVNSIVRLWLIINKRKKQKKWKNLEKTRKAFAKRLDVVYTIDKNNRVTNVERIVTMVVRKKIRRYHRRKGL